MIFRRKIGLGQSIFLRKIGPNHTAQLANNHCCRRRTARSCEGSDDHQHQDQRHNIPASTAGRSGLCNDRGGHSGRCHSARESCRGQGKTGRAGQQEKTHHPFSFLKSAVNPPCAWAHPLVKKTLGLGRDLWTALFIPLCQESVTLAKASRIGPLQLISNPTNKPSSGD